MWGLNEEILCMGEVPGTKQCPVQVWQAEKQHLSSNFEVKIHIRIATRYLYLITGYNETHISSCVSILGGRRKEKCWLHGN